MWIKTELLFTVRLLRRRFSFNSLLKKKKVSGRVQSGTLLRAKARELLTAAYAPSHSQVFQI